MDKDKIDDIDEQIQLMLVPSGDAAYLRVREEALAYLLAHADRAYPRLIALAQLTHPTPTLLLALPRFARPDSVPILEQALRNAPDPTTVIAAQALAEHPSSSARVVLERALDDPHEQVVASAADGIAQRGDKTSCPALRAALSHPDPDVRQRVGEAIVALGCP